MRICSIALGLVLASSAMAESKNLSDIYNLAVSNDPALRAQIATRDASEALGQQVRRGRGLTASASVSGKGTQNLKSDDVYRTGTLSLTLSMPLYDQGLDAKIESQDAAVREADASLAAYRQTHIISVTDRYFGVLSAEQDLLAARAEVEALERQLEQASERLVVGIGTRVDVDQARAQLDLSQVGLISAEVARDTARSDLEQLVDTSILDLLDLGEGFAADIHRSLDDQLEVSVDQHPDVIAEQESYQNALANLDEARSETNPTLALSSTFSISDTSGSNTAATNVSARSNVLSVTLSAPIYTNGVAAAKVGVAKANVIRAEANLAKVRRTVRASMQKAFRNLEASARTVEHDDWLLSLRRVVLKRPKPHMRLDRAISSKS